MIGGILFTATAVAIGEKSGALHLAMYFSAVKFKSPEDKAHQHSRASAAHHQIRANFLYNELDCVFRNDVDCVKMILVGANK